MSETKSAVDAYLSTLGNGELLEMYADAVRHDHYCPGMCRCFESWKMKVPIVRILQEIEARMKRGNPQEPGKDDESFKPPVRDDDKYAAEYREFVRSLMRDEDGRNILNRKIENALVVCEEFIDDAEDSVFLFCNDNHPVYTHERVKYALDRAVRRGLAIRVVPAVHPPGQGLPFNFLVVDGLRWRIEPNGSPGDELGAVANAHDPKNGGILVDYIDYIRRSSTDG